MAAEGGAAGTAGSARREALRAWIAKKNGKVSAEDIADDTPLIQAGILKSLQIMELILWLERSAGAAIDVERLKPGTFRTIDTICQTFFGDGDGAGAPA